jgi:hypothetical protein
LVTPLDPRPICELDKWPLEVIAGTWKLLLWLGADRTVAPPMCMLLPL